jgi:hypothetical protein
MKSPQLSSTPLKEDRSTAQSSPILACSPHAIDFEESALPDSKSSDVLARKKNSEITRSQKAKTVLRTDGSQTGDRSINTVTIVSPGLPGTENDRAELDDMHHELSMLQLIT